MYKETWRYNQEDKTILFWTEVNQFTIQQVKKILKLIFTVTDTKSNKKKDDSNILVYKDISNWMINR